MEWNNNTEANNHQSKNTSQPMNDKAVADAITMLINNKIIKETLLIFIKMGNNKKDKSFSFMPTGI